MFEVDAMKVALGSTPDPEVAALPKRRPFSVAYKRRIVGEANACQVPGEVGALLRREGLTAPTSRTGAGRSRPANRPRSPPSGADPNRIWPRPSRAGSRR
jgi:hypothetical protein